MVKWLMDILESALNVPEKTHYNIVIATLTRFENMTGNVVDYRIALKKTWSAIGKEESCIRQSI